MFKNKIFTNEIANYKKFTIFIKTIGLINQKLNLR